MDKKLKTNPTMRRAKNRMAIRKVVFLFDVDIPD